MILETLLVVEEYAETDWVLVTDPHEIARVLWRFGVEDEYAEGGYDFLTVKIGPYFTGMRAKNRAVSYNWQTYREVYAGRGHPFAKQSVDMLA